MPKLSSIIPSKLSSYLQTHLFKSSNPDPSTGSTAPPTPLPEEISIPLSTVLHVNYGSIDARYGVNPISGFDSLIKQRNSCTSSQPDASSSPSESGEVTSIACANMNTAEMYNSPLYDCMWRKRPLNPPPSSGDTFPPIPPDASDLDDTPPSRYVPNNVILGHRSSPDSQWRYEGSISHPLSIRARHIKAKRKEFKEIKAELLSSAIDFTHHTTSIPRSHNEVGTWNLMLDQRRSEDVKKVLENVLDERTKRTLGKQSRGGEYRLDRISWEVRGWDDSEGGKGRCRGPFLGSSHEAAGGTTIASISQVRADWVWKRVDKEDNVGEGKL